jgi:hypothetical protein
MTNKYLVLDNIVNYNYEFATLKLNCKKCNNMNDKNYKNETSYYYILDSGTEDMGYWIFESLIFINLLKKLNETNKKIKIVTNIKRESYILEFMKKYKIKNEIVYKIENYNNKCYSPLIYSIYYLHRLDKDEYYNSHLQKFIKESRENELLIKKCDNNIVNINFDPLFYYNGILLQNKNIYLMKTNIYKPNGLYTQYNGCPLLRYIIDIIKLDNKLIIN